MAALTVLTLLFLTGLFETLPEATLAAGVLVFDTLPGLFIGIAVSLLLLLYRASRPHVAVLGQVPGADGQYGDVLRHPENRQVPGIVILRLESGLFFANADALRDAIRAHAAEPSTRAVVLDAETIPYVDVTAARMLTLLSSDLEQQGVRLVVARDVGQVATCCAAPSATGRCRPPTRPCRTRSRRSGRALSASDGARRPRRPSTSSPGSPRPC